MKNDFLNREYDKNEFITAYDAMYILGVSKSTLYKALKNGDIPAIRIGRQWRIRRADLE